MIALNRPFELLWLFLAPLFRLPAAHQTTIHTVYQRHSLFDLLDSGGWIPNDQRGWSSWSPIRPPPTKREWIALQS